MVEFVSLIELVLKRLVGLFSKWVTEWVLKSVTELVFELARDLVLELELVFEPEMVLEP